MLLTATLPVGLRRSSRTAIASALVISAYQHAHGNSGATRTRCSLNEQWRAMTEITSLVDPSAFTPDDEEAIEAYIDRLPRERVVEALFIASRMRRTLYQFEKMASSRIVADGILSSGETWEAPDGVAYFWGGDRHREVTDPTALKQALIDLSADWGLIANRALGAAFKPQPDKVYLTELDKIKKFEGDETEKTIRNFTKWVETAPKLRLVEDTHK